MRPCGLGPLVSSAEEQLWVDLTSSPSRRRTTGICAHQTVRNRRTPDIRRRRAGRQYRADGRGFGRRACGRQLGPRRALVHKGAVARLARARHRGDPARLGLSEAARAPTRPAGKAGCHIPGGASPPRRSNCPTRPWPRSKAEIKEHHAALTRQLVAVGIVICLMLVLVGLHH